MILLFPGSNTLLSGCYDKSLQLTQNAAAHVLTRPGTGDHISPVFTSLHWLPVKSRVELQVLHLTYETFAIGIAQLWNTLLRKVED